MYLRGSGGVALWQRYGYKGGSGEVLKGEINGSAETDQLFSATKQIGNLLT